MTGDSTVDEAHLEAELRSKYHGLLELAVATGLETFGSANLPIAQVESMWLEPTGPGRQESHNIGHEVRDIGLFWSSCRSRLRTSTEWSQALQVVTDYIELIGAQPGGSWIGNTEIGYVERAIDLYFEKSEGFTFQSELASEVVDELVAYLKTDSIEIADWVALEGFTGPGEFELGADATIRAITKDQLKDLGLIREGPIRPGFTHRSECPRSDWWLCEVRVANPKGTSMGWNYAQSFRDKIRLGFRMFQQGTFSVVPLRTFQVEPFEHVMAGYGGQRTWGSRRGQPYILSAEEVVQLNEFWPPFCSVMDREHHYLQLSARRMDAAAARPRLEDEIVDYTIGLEGLLSTSEERTEIRYRFAVRGSVLLAEAVESRPQKFRDLRDLYDLRSAIVHGATPSKEDLESSVSLAEESLRACWKWYFEHYRDETNNRNGVEEIDRRLFLRT